MTEAKAKVLSPAMQALEEQIAQRKLQEQQAQKPESTTPLKFKAELPDWVKCPACGVEVGGLVSDVCYDCNHKRTQDQERQRRIQATLVETFGGEKAIKEFRVDKFMPTQGSMLAWQAARGFDPSRDNIYFWGPCGRGKTHLAYAIAIDQHIAGKNVVVVTQRELMNRFRKKSAEEEKAEMRFFTAADVLVIDDLGISKGTEFGLEVLCDILNKRALNYKNGLVITSNLFLNDLARKMEDDRLASRLGGMCRVIEINTPEDWRLRR